MKFILFIFFILALKGHKLLGVRWDLFNHDLSNSLPHHLLEDHFNVAQDMFHEELLTFILNNHLDPSNVQKTIDLLTSHGFFT